MSDQMPDLEALLQQAQVLQQQLMDAQAKAAGQIVEGKSAGGKVTIKATGGMEFQSVHIDPSLLDDHEILEDLLLAALHDVVNQVSKINQEATGDFGSLMG